MSQALTIFHSTVTLLMTVPRCCCNLPSLTQWPRAVAELAVIGVAVGISVVVCDGHVVQTVVLWRGRGGVWQAVGRVGQPVGGAETLARTDSAGPLVGVLGMERLPLKAVLFGSGMRKKIPE